MLCLGALRTVYSNKAFVNKYFRSNDILGEFFFAFCNMSMNWQLLISFSVKHTQKAPEMSFWLSPYGISYVKTKKSSLLSGQLSFLFEEIFRKLGNADKPQPQPQHCNCFIHNKVIVNILLVVQKPT